MEELIMSVVEESYCMKIYELKSTSASYLEQKIFLHLSKNKESENKILVEVATNIHQQLQSERIDKVNKTDVAKLANEALNAELIKIARSINREEELNKIIPVERQSMKELASLILMNGVIEQLNRLQNSFATMLHLPAPTKEIIKFNFENSDSYKEKLDSIMATVNVALMSKAILTINRVDAWNEKGLPVLSIEVLQKENLTAPIFEEALTQMGSKEKTFTILG